MALTNQIGVTVVIDGRRGAPRWVELDMTMHAITVAAHQASRAGLPAVAEDLLRLHLDVQRERDRS